MQGASHYALGFGAVDHAGLESVLGLRHDHPSSRRRGTGFAAENPALCGIEPGRDR